MWGKSQSVTNGTTSYANLSGSAVLRATTKSLQRQSFNSNQHLQAVSQKQSQSRHAVAKFEIPLLSINHERLQSYQSFSLKGTQLFYPVVSRGERQLGPSRQCFLCNIYIYFTEPVSFIVSRWYWPHTSPLQFRCAQLCYKRQRGKYSNSNAIFVALCCLAVGVYEWHCTSLSVLQCNKFLRQLWSHKLHIVSRRPHGLSTSSSNMLCV